MPELPEVETVCRALSRHLPGAEIVGVKSFAESLRGRVLDGDSLEKFCRGQRIKSLRRRAKYLLVSFEDGAGLILHLGMTGAFRVETEAQHRLHDRVEWVLADGRFWRFHDPRRFGSIQSCPDFAAAVAELDASLGPEPLSAEFDGAYLERISRNRQRPIKSLIMDQKFVVGVGNIYASESLFQAGIHPLRAAGRLSRKRCDLLVDCIKSVLTKAISLGGTTISDFHAPDGMEGKFTICLEAYGREGKPCFRCEGVIRRVVIGGRSTFYCPKCQH